MSIRSACVWAMVAAALAGCSTGTTAPVTSSTAATTTASAPPMTTPAPTTGTATTPAPTTATSASSAAPSASVSATPKAATDDFGIVIAQGKPGTPVVDIYIDFQCPYCGQLDRAIAPQLERAATERTARVAVHPMVFLDRGLGNDSSTRMAKLFICSSEVSTDVARHFYAAAFANQPTEGKGYDDAVVAKVFADATITADDVAAITQCAASPTYDGWVSQVDSAALERGVEGTPALFVNGTVFNPGSVATAEEFYKAITTPRG